MNTKTLTALLLTFSLALIGCSEKEAKHDTPSAINTYSGKWRYVDDGREFNIGLSNIENIYFLKNTESSAADAPDEFNRYGRYIFKVTSENLMVKKTKGETDRYLVRDGILNTHVTGTVAQPNQARAANLPLAAKTSHVGGANSVFTNQHTKDKYTATVDANGNIDSNNIPTGDYDVSIQVGDETFDAKLGISGAQTDLGVLNIADKNSFNFKVTASINSGIFKPGSTSTDKTVYAYSKPDQSDRTNFDYYRGQYVFPLGDLQKTDTADFDPFWITLSIQNISTNHAEGLNYEILCNEADWILECGGGSLASTIGTLRPNGVLELKIWIKIKAFNVESKQITLPIRIQDARGTTWDDSVGFKAYKKPHTVKVSMQKNNRGYLFLPGRSSISANSNRQFLQLPFIQDFTYELLYANSSSYNQSTYSIANGEALMPENSAGLEAGLSQRWNQVDEPANESDTTAPVIKAGSSKNAYLHTGDLDFYKLFAPNNLSISGNGASEQKILTDDTPVDSGTFLSFTAKDADGGSLTWLQVRGPKVDFTQEDDKLEVTIPELSQNHTLVFKVSATYQGTSYSPYDYLAISINKAKDFEIVSNNPNDLTSEVTLDNTKKNLELLFTTQGTTYGSPKPSNTFIISNPITLDSLILQEGITLQIRSTGSLKINDSLQWAGATLQVDKGATLDISALTNPSIPTDATLILDGELKLASGSGLVVNGNISHSTQRLAGLHLDIEGVLTINLSGSIDASKRGIKGSETYNWTSSSSCTKIYTEDLKELKQLNDCSFYVSGFHGGDGSTKDINTSPYTTYGNKQRPTTLGLGGIGYNSNYLGGNGGGAIHIQTPHLILKGKILANGEESRYAGGAGGSVWIDLQGDDGIFESSNGLIDISGGLATEDDYYHGGGGRLAITGCKDCSSINKTNWKGFNEISDDDGGREYDKAPNNGTYYQD